MLNDVVVASQGGTMLFHHAYVQRLKQPRMLASLIVALCEMATQRAGHAVSYVECQAVAVSIATYHPYASSTSKRSRSQPFRGDPGTHDGLETGSSVSPDEITAQPALLCAVLHDVDDGEAYGGILSKHILAEFVAAYGKATVKRRSGLVSVDEFQDFHMCIPDIVRASVGAVVKDIGRVEGVETCALITSDRVQVVVDNRNTPEVLDRVSMVANMHAVVDYARDLMATVHDQCEDILMTSLAIHLIGRNTALVTKISTAHDIHAFEEATAELRAVLSRAVAVEQSLGAK